MSGRKSPVSKHVQPSSFGPVGQLRQRNRWPVPKDRIEEVMKSSLKTTAVFLVAICLMAGALAVAQQDQAAQTVGQPPRVEAAGQESLEGQASFIMGYDLISQYKSVGVALDVESLIRGIRMAAEGKEMPMSDEACQAVVVAFNQQIETKRTAVSRMEMDKNLAAGREFQQQYLAKNNVPALESGVIHRVVQAGTGPTPAKENIVKIHYTGKLIDGTVFDSSVGGDPAEFPVSGVIRGMTECLLRMKVGEKCEMVLPAETAYGPDGPPSIGPGQTLVFEVELLGIVK